MIQRALLLVPIACFSLLAACSGDSQKPSPSGSEKATTASPGGTQSASGSAAGSGSAAAQPAGPATDFSVVAQLEGKIAIYGLKGAGFVDAGFFARLGDGGFKQDPTLFKGLFKSSEGRFMGIFPDGAWFFANSVPSGPTTFRWIKEQWGPVELLRDGERILDVAAWDDNRALAAIAMPTNDIRFFLMGGKPGVALPAPMGVKKEGDSDDSAPDDGSCKVKMSPSTAYRMFGLASGHLFAAGQECKQGSSGGPMVERWEPKKVRGTVESLPGVEGESVAVFGVVARAPDDAYVWGAAGTAPYLAHFDGKAWAADKAPFAKAPSRIAAADDGTLWAAAPDGVWKQAKGAAWTKLSLPSPGGATLSPTGLWVKSSTEVWVTAEGGKTGYLLAQKVDGPAVTLPSRAEMAQSLQANRRWLASPVCTKPYALIATVGTKGDKVPSGDFPQIKEVYQGRSEIAGVKFVLENDGANYYVGAQAPSVEVAKKLVEMYVAKNPKSVASVFCHEPVVLERELAYQ